MMVVEREPVHLAAKPRDYWWTVLAVDPVAFPLVRLFARTRLVTPDQVTWISMLLGLSVGPAFVLWGRAGLVVGGLLFYLSFVFDCVDGKLARLLGTSGGKGEMLDRVADGARRSSAVLGLTIYLWRTEGTAFWWGVVFGVLAFYFMEISGGERSEPRNRVGSRWSQALAKHRLLPTPGIPDTSAVAFVLGPVTGLVVPALALGILMVSVAILRVWLRAAR